MATATTPERIETHTAPVAEKPQRVEVRKVAIDNSTLSVLAVGVALFALAFGAFTHLRERIDNVATDLRSEIKDVNVKLDKLDSKLSGRMDGLDAKLEKLSAEQRAENREINVRLDRLFELVASQGRREPQ